jgi:putative ABC transport system ATP-binding protein
MSVVELALEGAARTYEGVVPVDALRPTTLEVRAGEFVALTGRSGSGKSTLLNILGLLDRPSAGSYRVRGIEVGGLRERELTSLRAAEFGFVFQAFHLLPDRTALENVALGLMYRGICSTDRRELAAVALRRVGLAHREHALPAELSGGERQRVAVARALTQRPTVLLCDEPTGNLDRRNAEGVIGLLSELNASGLTVLIATHDEQLAATLPRVLSVDDGIVSQRR